MANLLVSGIIEKMTHSDLDDRTLATSDLLHELNKDSFKLDMDLEMRLSSILLQQVDDVVIDVSILAVKCLALLVKKIGEEQIVEMTKKLCDKLLQRKYQHHDTAIIALRTVVAQVVPWLVPSILVTLTPQMIGGISGQSTRIKCGCLKIMCDVVQKYGSLMADDHEKLLNTLLVQLGCKAADVSRLAVKCLALLLKKFGEELIVEMTCKLCDKLLKGMSTGTKCGCLEIMCDVVKKYGNLMVDDHEKLLKTLLMQLGCNEATVRKKTVTCIDNGFELRKASFQCVYNLLDMCPDKVIPSSFFVPFLRSTLKDNSDLKMMCHDIVSLLADKFSAVILSDITKITIFQTINEVDIF